MVQQNPSSDDGFFYLPALWDVMLSKAKEHLFDVREETALAKSSRVRREK